MRGVRQPLMRPPRSPFALSLSKGPCILSLPKDLSLSKGPCILSLPKDLSLSKSPCILSLPKDPLKEFADV
jgi:hypothetical protein